MAAWNKCQAIQTSDTSIGMELGERRRATGAIERESFTGRSADGGRDIKRVKLWNIDTGCTGGAQRGKVQSLADVAGSIVAAGLMFVQESAASGEVKKCGYGEQRHGAPRGSPIKKLSRYLHTRFGLHFNLHLSTRLPGKRLLSEHQNPQPLDPAPFLA